MVADAEPIRPPRTSAEVRRAIQNSTDSIRVLAARYAVDPKTVAKWRRRSGVDDRKTGRKSLGSSLLSAEHEALIALFRQHLPLSLDDTLQALRLFLPQLTRSSLHRLLQRHGLSRRPGGARPRGEPARAGEFVLSHTPLRLAAGTRHLFVAMEAGSQFAFAELHDDATAAIAARFLHALIKAAPGGVHTVETEADAVFAANASATRPAHAFASACRTQGIRQQWASASLGWSLRQRNRMRQLLEQAIDRHHRGDSLAQLRRRLASLLAAYNSGCRLSRFGGWSPLERARRLASPPPGAPRPRAGAAAVDSAARAVTDAGLPKAPRPGRRRRRDPDSTRQAILQAARSRLAHDGPEGLSLAEVARIAGVNRGTAYQHFETRDKLIAETADWVSEKLFEAVFGSADPAEDRPAGSMDVAQVTDRLAHFAMDNPELCRAWLLKVLSSPDPAGDLFWRKYQGSTEQFSKTALAQDAIDTEVLSVIMLAGAFLWPVWARAKAREGDDPRALAHRFAQEGLRISMYGNLRSERYPAIAARLAAGRPPPRKP